MRPALGPTHVRSWECASEGTCKSPRAFKLDAEGVVVSQALCGSSEVGVSDHASACLVPALLVREKGGQLLAKSVSWSCLMVWDCRPCLCVAHLCLPGQLLTALSAGEWERRGCPG